VSRGNAESGKFRVGIKPAIIAKAPAIFQTNAVFFHSPTQTSSEGRGQNAERFRQKIAKTPICQNQDSQDEQKKQDFL
jgi:hypothetical protein